MGTTMALELLPHPLYPFHLVKETFPCSQVFLAGKKFNFFQEKCVDIVMFS